MKKLNTLMRARWVLLLMSFFGFVVAYIIRANLSVAIIAMVHPIKSVRKNYACNSSIFSKHLAKGPPLTLVTKSFNQNATDSVDETPNRLTKLEALSWDKMTQGYVLASFFYGYIVTQIPGGWLSYKYGSKHVLGAGILLASILSLLNPVLALYSPYALMLARFGQGLGEGVMLPAMHHLISKWAEPMERTKMATIVYSGIPIGTILAMPISGYLAKYGFAGGWPSIFYLTGLIGCVWFVLWCYLVYEDPLVHPRISETEKELLHRSEEKSASRTKQEWKHIPLRSIFGSLPFWAICISNVSHTWGLYTLITALPTYLRDVLNLDIYSNGLFSALPFIAMWLFIVVGGQVADYARSRHSAPTIVVRKVHNSLGLFIPAALFVGLSYVGCHQIMALTLLTGAAAFLGFANSGYMVNPLDIAPPYAGILFSLSNTFGTLSGIVSPSVTSAFTAHQSGPNEWRKVFIVSAVILWVGATVFSLCASGLEQPWSLATKRSGRPKEVEAGEEATREML